MDNTRRRANLMLDADVIKMLDDLAEGERKRGQYISELIRNAYATRQATPNITSMDIDALRLMVQGLAGRVMSMEGEVADLRSQLAAMIAEKA